MDNEAKGVTSADAKLGAHVVLPEPEPELIELVREQLDLSPTEILQTLLGNCWPGCRDGLRAAYETGDLAVVVGPVAAASAVRPSVQGRGVLTARTARTTRGTGQVAVARRRVARRDRTSAAQRRAPRALAGRPGAAHGALSGNWNRGPRCPA